jgi:Tat protein translocase TatB subunit
MFGLGTWEVVMIVGVALIVLGPDRLPEMARKIGKGMRDVRRAANDFTRELHIEELQDLRNMALENVLDDDDDDDDDYEDMGDDLHNPDGTLKDGPYAKLVAQAAQEAGEMGPDDEMADGESHDIGTVEGDPIEDTGDLEPTTAETESLSDDASESEETAGDVIARTDDQTLQDKTAAE